MTDHSQALSTQNRAFQGSQASTKFENLAPKLQAEVDSICSRFEAEWLAGERPDLRYFLTGSPNGAPRRVLLRELLRVELECRRLAGEYPTLEQVLQELPEFESVVRNEFARQGQYSHSTQRASATPVGATHDWATVADGSEAGGTEQRRSAVSSRYQLGEEIARGGMGVIFRATDRQFHREVAIKVLQPYWQREFTPERLQQLRQRAITEFRYEAQITARLQHPAIPPVHELGSFADGLPFLAMKLIQGQSFKQLLQARVDLHTELPRWLLIFEQIAQAVGYAHRHGILHRDLKPQNVMVGEFGEVQVMDWGLAKVLKVAERADDTAIPEPQEKNPERYATRRGDLKGTLAYMAPEQARGEVEQIDCRVDTFGLGAILCEILTGSPPYQGSTHDKLKQLAQAADLQPAIERLRNCGAEVEVVDLALRCLAPAPADRPADGTAVARAVAAHRASVEQRLRRAETERAVSEQRRCDLARQRWLWYGIAAILLVLVVVTIYSNRVIAHRESQTRDEAAISSSVRKFLQEDLLLLADPDLQSRAGVPVDPSLQVRELVRRAGRNIDGQFTNQPRVEAELRFVIGKALVGMGEFAEAHRHWQRFLEVSEHLHGPNHPDTVTAKNNLATLLYEEGNYAESARLLEVVVQQRAKILGAVHQDTLVSRSNLGNAWLKLGRINDSLKLQEETLRLTRQLLGPNHTDTLNAMCNLGNSYLDASQLHDAIRVYAEALEILGKKQRPDHRLRLGLMGNLANAYMYDNQFEQALRLQELALKERQKALGPKHPDTLMSMNNLALLQMNMGEFERAKKLAREAWDLHREVLGAEHPETLRALSNLADAHARLQENESAIPYFAEVLQHRERTLGPNHLDTIRVQLDLAESLQFADRVTEAIPLQAAALERLQKISEPAAEEKLLASAGLASMYMEVERTKDAIPLLEDVLANYRQAERMMDLNALSVLNNLAYAYEQVGRLEEARSRFAETLQLYERANQRSYPDSFTSRMGLIRTATKLKDFLAAEKQLDEAEEFVAQFPDPLRGNARRSLADLRIALYEAWEKPAEVAKWQEILKKLEGGKGI